MKSTSQHENRFLKLGLKRKCACDDDLKAASAKQKASPTEMLSIYPVYLN